MRISSQKNGKTGDCCIFQAKGNKAFWEVRTGYMWNKEKAELHLQRECLSRTLIFQSEVLNIYIVLVK